MYSNVGTWHINMEEAEFKEEDLNISSEYKKLCRNNPGKWKQPPCGNLQFQPAKQQGSPSQLAMCRGESLSHCAADATCNILGAFITEKVHRSLCEISTGAINMKEFCDAALVVLAASNLDVTVEFRNLRVEDGTASSMQHARFSLLKKLSHCGSGRLFIMSPASWSGPATHAVGVRGCEGGGALVFDSHSNDKPVPFAKFFNMWPKKVQFLRELAVREKKRSKRASKKRKRRGDPELQPGNAKT